MLRDLCFFVPARASSQRVKSKNIKPFCNSTLIEIKLTQIKRAFPNSYLVFDTDSQEYIDRVKHLCDRSTLRPAEFGISSVPMNKVYKYFAESLSDFKHIAYCNATSPLISDFSMQQIYSEYINSHCCPITTVTKHKEYLWINGKPLNYDPNNHPRSQDLPYFETLNFAMSILPIDVMREKSNIVARNSTRFSIPSIEAFDIDEEWQFNIAEMLFTKINNLI